MLVLYFFRDPQRKPIQEPGLVVSAADGEVVAIVQEQAGTLAERETLRISVFLSILDVHVQRVPLAGTVMRIEHRPGKFRQAFRPEASEENEAITTELATAFGPVVVRQIAGIMARRCVNYLAVGQAVETGQRFGLIRFGSRVDLFLPPTAEILVTIGSKVQGGTTPVARLTK
jgi:phosphatidylserine decarboxylase